MRVEPDKDRPLTWVPGSQLAINVKKTEQLEDQRGRAEEYLKSQFGVLPDLRAFKPHITVATVEKGSLPGEICSDPNALLSGYDVAPPKITLNGLEVYLGRIHQGETTAHGVH